MMKTISSSHCSTILLSTSIKAPLWAGCSVAWRLVYVGDTTFESSLYMLAAVISADERASHRILGPSHQAVVLLSVPRPYRSGNGVSGASSVVNP
jgi:hypothetical protein